MEEEIKRVLKLIEEKKITSDQAAKLIEAIKKTEELQVLPEKNKQHLRVHMASHKGDSINFRIPLKFAQGLIKATGKLPIEVKSNENFDIKPVLTAIEKGATGKITEYKSTKGDLIEMIIE